MINLLYKLKRTVYITKIIINIFFIVTLLTACSISPRYKYQANDNKSYLHTTPLIKLLAPTGIVLPSKSKIYNIPDINKNSAVSKDVDIRPPNMLSTPISSMYIQFIGNTAILSVENWDNDTLWKQVINIMQKKKLAINKRDDNNKILVTDLIQLKSFDKNYQYRGCYQISVKSYDYQQFITVNLLNYTQQKETAIHQKSMQRYWQYYCTMLLDIIYSELSKHTS